MVRACFCGWSQVEDRARSSCIRWALMVWRCNILLECILRHRRRSAAGAAATTRPAAGGSGQGPSSPAGCCRQGGDSSFASDPRFAQNDRGRVAGPVRCAALRFRFFASLREILSEAMTGGQWRQGRQRRVDRDGQPGGNRAVGSGLSLLSVGPNYCRCREK